MVVKKKNIKKKKIKESTSDDIERELYLKTDEQEYAKVTKMLGNCRLEVQCVDGMTRICHIRGTMTKKRKKVWIELNDIILVSLREYEDTKCDAIHKYTPSEIKRLKIIGEIPESMIEINETKEDDNLGIEFVIKNKHDIDTDDEDEETKDTELNIDEI